MGPFIFQRMSFAERDESTFHIRPNPYSAIATRQQSEIRQLRARILDLEAQANRPRPDSSHISVKVLELEGCMKHLRSQNEDLTSRLAESETARRAVENKYAQLKERYELQINKYDQLVADQLMASRDAPEILRYQDHLRRVQREKDELLRLAQRAKEKLDHQISQSNQLRQERDDNYTRWRKEHKSSKANHDRAMELDKQVRALQMQLAEQQEQNRMLSEEGQRFSELTKEMMAQAGKFATLKLNNRKLLGQVASLNDTTSELGTQVERYQRREEKSRKLQYVCEQQAQELERLRTENEKLSDQIVESTEELNRLRMSHEADLERLGRQLKVAAARKEKLQTELEGERRLTTRQLAQANDRLRELSKQNEQAQLDLSTKANIIKTLSQELDRVKKANNELESLSVTLQAQVDAAQRRTSSLLGKVDVSEKMLAELHRAVDSLQSSNEGPPPDATVPADEPVVAEPGVEVDIEQVVNAKESLGRFIRELAAIDEELTESPVEDWNADAGSGAGSDGGEAAPAKNKVQDGSEDQQEEEQDAEEDLVFQIPLSGSGQDGTVKNILGLLDAQDYDDDDGLGAMVELEGNDDNEEDLSS
jgi:chromosome segregation ATPase